VIPQPQSPVGTLYDQVNDEVELIPIGQGDDLIKLTIYDDQPTILTSIPLQIGPHDSLGLIWQVTQMLTLFLEEVIELLTKSLMYGLPTLTVVVAHEHLVNPTASYELYALLFRLDLVDVLELILFRAASVRIRF
jgi:hypothetical protein